jgi:pentatricopeptide repeat domain-containing protein 1
MINTYGRWGLFVEAQKVWHEMRVAGCVPDATAFCGLINSYSHHGMYKVMLSTILSRRQLSQCFD